MRRMTSTGGSNAGRSTTVVPIVVERSYRGERALEDAL
jgi:hypothetical protein